MSKNSPEERALVDRFLVAFNRVEAAMQKNLKSNDAFAGLIQEMVDRRRIFHQEYTFLDNCRKLRNILVHQTYKVDLYMALPGSGVVTQLEKIAAQLEDAPTVYTYFSKDVQFVSVDDTMYRVMKLIQDTDYTQFPVHDENKKFVNLLTENVLTRWLAKHVVTIQEMAFADLRHTVKQVLTLQSDDEHWKFIPRNMTVPEATAIFAEKPTIEALIITERGKRKEAPIGIVTRSDALDMLDGKRD